MLFDLPPELTNVVVTSDSTQYVIRFGKPFRITFVSDDDRATNAHIENMGYVKVGVIESVETNTGTVSVTAREDAETWLGFDRREQAIAAAKQLRGYKCFRLEKAMRDVMEANFAVTTNKLSPRDAEQVEIPAQTA